MRVDGSDWLYAIGDVNGRALLTHMGKYQGRICADHVLGKDVEATADRYGVPQVIFTEPQVACGRQDARRGRGGRHRRPRRRRRDLGHRGRELLRTERPRDDADRRRRGPARHRRRHLRRRRDRRLPARGDGRGARRGAAGPPLARRPLLPDAQRDLAEADGGVRALGPPAFSTHSGGSQWARSPSPKCGGISPDASSFGETRGQKTTHTVVFARRAAAKHDAWGETYRRGVSLSRVKAACA